MTKEETQEIPPEERVWQFRDQIVQKLKERGGKASRLKGEDGAPRVGIDYARIIDNEKAISEGLIKDHDYWALLLDADGNWIVNYDTAGFKPDQTFNSVLNNFARANADPSIANDEPRLTSALVIRLETTLQELSTPQITQP